MDRTIQEIEVEREIERERERERGGERMKKLIVIIEILFVVGLVGNAAAYNEGDVIHVAGKVLCQDCSLSFHDWINGSAPIKRAVVSITCMDERRRVRYYGSDETDERGEFDLLVNKTLNGKDLKPRLCTVRLVSSPDRSCDIPTDFGKGQTGVKLLRPFSVYRDLVKYVVGPFYYTTPMCDVPKTENTGGRY
ncbi:PREDICTED: proline-rich protein 1 [Tarenaya hassleriana]|uniref:proline-rich protein 1 n=1 Tax=Tarenaya hassleriana TaxID=28532 RepID=UPI0008FD0BD5|nr:PREDICTED: proline-rich protein 1 [Tarenaya hassleriana]